MLFVTLTGCATSFEANLSQFFTDFNLFVMLTLFSDAEMSRSSDFSDDNNQQTKLIALPLAHACRVNTGVLQIQFDHINKELIF